MRSRATGLTRGEVAALYEREGRALWARLYAVCCDRELALEAVQEAFLRLFEQGTEGILDLAAWLYRVGRNWLCDVARRRRSVPEGDQILASTAAGFIDPAAGLLSEEMRGQIRDALQQLREEDREILVLRYALDWRSERIAEVLDLTPAAVDMRLSRARKRLADALCALGVGHDSV